MADADTVLADQVPELGNNFTVCILVSKRMKYSKGIVTGEIEDIAQHYVFPIFMIQVVSVFFISRLIHFLLRPLKQPKFVCNVLTGILLGPSGLCSNKKIMDALFPRREMVVVNTLSALGGIYFLFIVSVKMDTARILRTAKTAWVPTLTCLAVPFTISSCLSFRLQEYTPGIRGGGFRFYLSSLLSLNFFAVISDALNELNLLTSELGQLAASSAMLNELISWFLVVLGILMQKEAIRVFVSFLCLSALLLFTFYIAGPTIRLIVRNTPEGKPVQQIYVIAILTLPLIMSLLTDMLGLGYVPGALMSGLAVPAGQPLGSMLTDKCEAMMANLLLPFFYIRIGQLTNIHSITDIRTFLALKTIILGAYLGKVAGSLFSMLCFKTSLRYAFLFSFILNIRGINEFIILVRLRVSSAKFIDEASYATMVLSDLLVTAIVTPLISIFYKPRRRLESTSSIGHCRRTLQTTSMSGELRILCGIHYEDNIYSIITLLKASNPNEFSPICAYVVHFVELVGRALPLLQPYDIMEQRIKESPTDRIMRAVTKHFFDSGDPVSIVPLKMIAPYKTMHESICRLVEDKYIPLVLVPFHKRDEIEGGSSNTASLRNFNMKLQKYAPCTVGIFVDRHFASHLNSSPSYFKFAVFFIGGPDDREVISFVSRMAGHPHVGITVFRIDFTEDNRGELYENERKLDDIAVNEFVAKNFGNSGVLCRHVIATNVIQVMDSIRSIENNYDLVIVGKRRGTNSRLEEEMKPWVEYEELGAIGDMLASVDFCEGNMSVLVIQCGCNDDSDCSSVLDENETSRFSFNLSNRDRNDEILLAQKYTNDDRFCTKV